MQHFSTDYPTSSRLEIEAWVRGVNSYSELTDPAARPTQPAKCSEHEHVDTHLMGGSPKKHMALRPSATNNDVSCSTRSMSRKSEGSKAVGFTGVAVQEEPASTSTASGYNLISKAPSSSLPTMTSSNGTLHIKSSSSKKKTVAKRENLALLSPTIQFRA